MKGRKPPETAPTDHTMVLRDRLGSAAAQAFNPGVKWETYAEVQREQYRDIGQAVLDSFMTQKCGGRGAFEVASGVSAQTGEPYMEIWIDHSPAQFSPDKAREIGLLLIESADAAETEALLMTFLKGAGLEMEDSAKLLYQLRQMREKRRGKAVVTA